jgi:hypothetical protein
MAFLVHCRAPCEPNLPLVLPPYPPCYPGCGNGGVTPPIDPTILAVTCPTIPSTAVTGTATTIRVLGQNFTATCVAFLDNVAQTTSFVSATELTFTATGTVAKTSTITVKDGATTATGTCQFVWTLAPILTVTCPLTPATAVVGTAPLQVTVNGTLFTNTCEVLLDGTAVPTTYVSATQLRGTIDPTAETARIATVGVRENATGTQAVTTCPFEFTVVLVPPVVTSVVPDYIGNWDQPKLVTVTGTGFDATTFISMNLTQYATTLVSPTTVTFMTTGAISNATLTLRAHNGTMANASNPVIFMCVENPTLGMLSPTTMAVTDPPTPLYVLGSGYGNTAKILFDGVIQPTTIFNGGQVTCTVTPSLYTAGQVVQVTVQLGHDPVHVDNVLPVNSPNTNPPNGPLTLPLTFT